METLRSYRFSGDDAEMKLRDVMKMFRYGFKTLGGLAVIDVLAGDSAGTADVLESPLEYRLAGGATVTLTVTARRTDDKPLLEVHISAAGENDEEAAGTEQRIRSDLESIIYMDHGMGYCCE